MLPAVNRLKKNFQFRYVYKFGKGVPCKHFLLIYTTSKNKTPRFGISVSNKIGKAVLRNYIKRLLRESVRTLLPQIKPGYNCVVRANQGFDFTFDTPYHDILASMRYVLKKADLLYPTL